MDKNLITFCLIEVETNYSGVGRYTRKHQELFDKIFVNLDLSGFNEYRDHVIEIENLLKSRQQHQDVSESISEFMDII